MNDDAVEEILAQYAERYPPLVTSGQAAEIAQVPIGTLYDWSSRGLLDGLKHRRGRRLLLQRDLFVRFLMSDAAEEELELIGSA